MSVNSALDKLENIIAGAWRIPMTKGKCAISTEEVQNLIDDIRLALPKEIKQAKIIVEDRNNILSNARQEARNMLSSAQRQSEYMVSKEYVVEKAKKLATKILSNAKQKTTEMRQQTNIYVENLVDSLDRVITTTAKNFRGSANEIRAIIKKGHSKK